jgi:hypothetical protein
MVSPCAYALFAPFSVPPQAAVVDFHDSALAVVAAAAGDGKIAASSARTSSVATTRRHAVRGREVFWWSEFDTMQTFAAPRAAEAPPKGQFSHPNRASFRRPM